MSVSIYVTSTEELPSSIEALDGLDQIILASNRLKTDPVTLSAIRSWVERGGLLWVMLDRVDPDMLGPILGESFVPTVVDRNYLLGASGDEESQILRPGKQLLDGWTWRRWPRELEKKP